MCFDRNHIPSSVSVAKSGTLYEDTSPSMTSFLLMTAALALCVSGHLNAKTPFDQLGVGPDHAKFDDLRTLYHFASLAHTIDTAQANDLSRSALNQVEPLPESNGGSRASASISPPSSPLAPSQKNAKADGRAPPHFPSRQQREFLDRIESEMEMVLHGSPASLQRGLLTSNTLRRTPRSLLRKLLGGSRTFTVAALYEVDQSAHALLSQSILDAEMGPRKMRPKSRSSRPASPLSSFHDVEESAIVKGISRSPTQTLQQIKELHRALASIKEAVIAFAQRAKWQREMSGRQTLRGVSGWPSTPRAATNKLHLSRAFETARSDEKMYAGLLAYINDLQTMLDWIPHMANYKERFPAKFAELVGRAHHLTVLET